MKQFKKTCPLCGREFEFLNKKQLEFNLLTHLGSCKNKQKKIAENLKLVKEGKPLNISLVRLNGEFKKQYFKCSNCGKRIKDGNLSGYCEKCYIKCFKEYNQQPERKSQIKEYNHKYYLKHKNDSRIK